MKPEVQLISGDEYDSLTGWRRLLMRNRRQRAMIKHAKRSYRKRVRQHIKKEIERLTDDT